MYTIKYMALYLFYFQILQGNTERDVVVTNKLDPPMPSVKFLRIHPKTWQEYLALRFELLGCEDMGEIKYHNTFKLSANKSMPCKQ